MKILKATTQDYIDLQGGEPSIKRRNGLFHIRHNYSGGQGTHVVTHINPASRGTVVIDGKEFEVAKLLRFEGGPCQRLSSLAGGEGYNRRK